MTCPVCKSARFGRYYTGITSWEYPGRFNFVCCRHCGLILQHPRVPQDRVGQYYNPQSYWGEVHDAWQEYAPLYRAIFKSRSSAGSILDVGSGLGLFLSEFKKRGWQTLGTEISPDMVRHARRTYGLKILQGDLLKLRLTGQFDVICLNNVLEHLYYPRQTLVKIHSLLRPGGMLVIVVPNIDSLGHAVFRRRWYHLQPGRHVYHFSPATITQLLESTGFHVAPMDHSYWRHNYYSWFCNFRYNYSLRFTVNRGTPVAHSSPGVKIGKVIVPILAGLGAMLGQITRHGEVITIYCHR